MEIGRTQEKESHGGTWPQAGRRAAGWPACCCSTLSRTIQYTTRQPPLRSQTGAATCGCSFISSHETDDEKQSLSYHDFFFFRERCNYYLVYLRVTVALSPETAPVKALGRVYIAVLLIN